MNYNMNISFIICTVTKQKIKIIFICFFFNLNNKVRFTLLYFLQIHSIFQKIIKFRFYPHKII